MQILKKILNIIFPASCKQCGGAVNSSSFTSSFCNTCCDGIKWFDGHCCPRCGIPYPSMDVNAGGKSPLPLGERGRVRARGAAAHTCGECIKIPPYFDKAISAGPYKDTLAEAIKLFKYKKKIHIGRALAEEAMKLISCETSMGKLLTKGYKNQRDKNVPPILNLVIDNRPPQNLHMDRRGFPTPPKEFPSVPNNLYVAIPVPLHPQRLREREFNQSAIIASVISSRFAIPMMTNVLLRQRYTKPQVELGFRERKENVEGAFTLQNKEAIQGKNIILVDDVFTTGSTVNECAKVLKKNGADKVYVVTIARMV